MEVKTQHSLSTFDFSSHNEHHQFSCIQNSGTSVFSDLREPECVCSVSNAAMKVQKVYRSYRTRRMLADSAVVAEVLWWQAIDYARLNHSTVSFFNFLKPETASSRWNRIGLNASKSVFEEIQKGFKYNSILVRSVKVCPKMLKLRSWHFNTGLRRLDLGDGKKVDLEECPRSKLQKQSIKYLGPQEREHYEYIVAEGNIAHEKTGNLLDTTKGLPGAKWIFVMSTSRRLYAGEKKKGMFHHSSFLAGGATLAAGRLVVKDGRVVSISAYSGHYRPTEDRLDSFLSFLQENGVNLDEVEIRKSNEDYDSHEDRKSIGRVSTSDFSALSDALSQVDPSKEEEEVLPSESARNLVAQTSSYNRSLTGGLQIPVAEVRGTPILRRIHSEKYTKSHQLPLVWSTGAGPRIGCVANFPAELKWQALELTNLSPRPCSVCSTTIPMPVHTPLVNLQPITLHLCKCLVLLLILSAVFSSVLSSCSSPSLLSA